MSLINISNLTFSYDTGYDEIFRNVSFQIDTNWKLGFIGRNGMGKTTFLHLLMGKHEYAGQIHADVEFKYFPCPVPDEHKRPLDIFRDICPGAMDWEIACELGKLNMGEDVLLRPFDTLSGGEQSRFLLAALFLTPGAFLLIDEPTNHLDTAGRDIVKQYLKQKQGFILVSHDRSLLDECVDHVLSHQPRGYRDSKGKFLLLVPEPGIAGQL